MKKLVAVILMMFATQALAESAAEAMNRAREARQSACSVNGGNTPACGQAVTAESAEQKRFMNSIYSGMEARRQHDQEVMRDEQLREQARRRAY